MQRLSTILFCFYQGTSATKLWFIQIICLFAASNRTAVLMETGNWAAVLAERVKWNVTGWSSFLNYLEPQNYLG